LVSGSNKCESTDPDPKPWENTRFFIIPYGLGSIDTEIFESSSKEKQGKNTGRQFIRRVGKEKQKGPPLYFLFKMRLDYADST
jgi:hypothetical protein